MILDLEIEPGRYEQASAEPICGEDFCDHCGDCLHCCATDECPSVWHTWVVYAEDVEEFMQSRPVRYPADLP